MPRRIASGISFPFRFGTKGGVAGIGVVRSGTPDAETAHIRESVYQILATEPGERVMEVEFGCRLRDIIFEHLDLTVVSIIRDRITRALRRWEPRIRVDDITVHPNEEENSVVVKVMFTVIDTGAMDVTEISFRR